QRILTVRQSKVGSHIARPLKGNGTRLAQESGAEGGRGGEGDVEAEVGAVEEGGEFGEAEGEAFGGGGAEGDVAKLAAGAGGLTVEVEVSVRDGEDCGGVREV